MVRFEGILSDKCVLYRIKRSMLSVIIGEAVGLVVIAPLLIIFSVLYDYNIISSIIVTVLLAIVLLTLVVEYYVIKKPRISFNIELVVDADYIEYSVGISKKEKIPISSIKKVIKRDQCYYIVRRYGDVSTSLMAETSLIKEGSVAEFESLFNGKIKQV